MKKVQNAVKRLLGIVLLMAVGAVFGYFLGEFAGNYGKGPFSILGWFAVTVLLYCTQLIFHEAGHYLFGRLTGYTFVSFRIGDFTWIREKESGKLLLKKYKLPGTGGQCLMMPPKEDEAGNVFVLYHMGGVLVNLFFTGIGIFLYIQGKIVNIKAFGAILAFVAGISALSNGIPLKINGMVNDGYNILMLKRDKTARRSTAVMLRVNALLTQGVRMKEMPYEWFVLPEDADLSNASNATIRIMEGNWFFDKLQFEEAKTCYETLLQDSVGLLEIHKLELQCELLFFELIGLQREEVIKELYTRKLKSYIKTMSSVYINKKRLQYVLCLYERRADWEKELETIYQEAVKLGETYPIQAEVESEMEVFDFLRASKQIFAALLEEEKQAEPKTEN